MAALGDPRVRAIVVYHLVNNGKTGLNPAGIMTGEPVSPPIRRVSKYRADALLYNPNVYTSGAMQHLVNMRLLPKGAVATSTVFRPESSAFSVHIKHAHSPQVVTSRESSLWDRVANALVQDEWNVELYV